MTTPPLAGILEQTFSLASSKVPVALYAWCVMPDHVHALVAPRENGSVIRWVQVLKSLTAHQARGAGVSRLWQRGYHDHVLRMAETIPEVVRYVLENPARAGLVSRWQEWRHSGSLEWDLTCFE
ncbi:MAG: transposase [Planctomycetes bacterium]|nr:transposase [Planctomycetota bacterium]